MKFSQNAVRKVSCPLHGQAHRRLGQNIRKICNWLAVHLVSASTGPGLLMSVISSFLRATLRGLTSLLQDTLSVHLKKL